MLGGDSRGTGGKKIYGLVNAECVGSRKSEKEDAIHRTTHPNVCPRPGDDTDRRQRSTTTNIHIFPPFLNFCPLKGAILYSTHSTSSYAVQILASSNFDHEKKGEMKLRVCRLLLMMIVDCDENDGEALSFKAVSFYY